MEHVPEFLSNAPRHLFFTGKGGVGKTSLACASAVLLAEANRRVLLVSTDPASNLDAVLATGQLFTALQYLGFSSLALLGAKSRWLTQINVRVSGSMNIIQVRPLSDGPLSPQGGVLLGHRRVTEEVNAMAALEVSASDRLQRFERNSQNLAAAQPEAIKAFWQLHRTTTATSALDTKTKELIALAISVVMRCDDCIAHHVSDALEAGARREEIADALAVATLMGGGIGLVYATHAIEAVDHLLDQRS